MFILKLIELKKNHVKHMEFKKYFFCYSVNLSNQSKWFYLKIFWTSRRCKQTSAEAAPRTLL